MSTAPPQTARVLELGCAAGGNLLPFAVAHPGARCVGLDISSVQVAHGRAAIAALGLTNATLEVADLTTWHPEPQAWDYIVCHGVYSWVGEEVQAAILRIVSEGLAPHGVAVVSYNVSPGWRLQSGVRDALTALQRPGLRRAETAAHARQVIEVLAASLADSPSPWAQTLTDTRAHAEQTSESYLLHEYLGGHHDVLTLRRFVGSAASSGLRYLGDAGLTDMLPPFLPEPVQRFIAERARDVVSTEQLLDALRGRAFRHSLLVPAGTPLRRDLSRFDATDLHLATSAEGVPDPERPHRTAWHASDALGEPPLWVTEAPWFRALMDHLKQAWPRSVPFLEASEHARDVAGRDRPPASDTTAWHLHVGQVLLYAHGLGVVELHRGPLDAVTSVEASPRVWSWAREQLKTQTKVTTLRHETLSLAPLEAAVAARCDGLRSRDDILEELQDAVRRHNEATGESSPLLTSEALDHVLFRLASLSLMGTA